MDLYQAKQEGRADWANWLFEYHVFVVAERAGMLADRFGANKELAMAAGMLHDIADAVMRREDPKHEEESATIARRLLREAGFSDEETRVIVDDAMKRHGCHEGDCPLSLEGRVMATADALAHLQTDFYEHAIEARQADETIDQIKKWALSKLERDINAKIFFSEVREEVRLNYERLKCLFSEKQE